MTYKIHLHLLQTLTNTFITINACLQLQYFTPGDAMNTSILQVLKQLEEYLFSVVSVHVSNVTHDVDNLFLTMQLVMVMRQNFILLTATVQQTMNCQSLVQWFCCRVVEVSCERKLYCSVAVMHRCRNADLQIVSTTCFEFCLFIDLLSAIIC